MFTLLHAPCLDTLRTPTPLMGIPHPLVWCHVMRPDLFKASTQTGGTFDNLMIIYLMVIKGKKMVLDWYQQYWYGYGVVMDLQCGWRSRWPPVGQALDWWNERSVSGWAACRTAESVPASALQDSEEESTERGADSPSLQLSNHHPLWWKEIKAVNQYTSMVEIHN